MIAGAGGTIATQAENVIKAVRPAGKVPGPGPASGAPICWMRLSSADRGRTASSSTTVTANGSAHCGCVVIPTVLAVG